MEGGASLADVVLHGLGICAATASSSGESFVYPFSSALSTVVSAAEEDKWMGVE